MLSGLKSTLKEGLLYLTYRATQPKDLPQCFEMITERPAFDSPQSRKDLMAFWKAVLKDRSCISAVVEDRERPEGGKIVGFGMSLFVTDEFAREALTTLPPFLVVQAVDRWKRKKIFFLDRKSVARHNSEKELKLMVVNYGVERQKSIELELPIREKMLQSLVFFHGGYQVTEIFQEGYGPQEKELIISNLGFHLRREYDEFAGKTPLVRTIQPFLYGVTREEAINSPGLGALPFFLCPNPRFGFSLGEQDVLEMSLLEGTDEDIARAMDLTIWAVKKRWQEIYKKVEKLDPAILEGAGEKVESEEEPQKSRRRFLLNYLRIHLEEIRPSGVSRRGGKRVRKKSK